MHATERCPLGRCRFTAPFRSTRPRPPYALPQPATSLAPWVDEYTQLEDRVDAPPLSLPPISRPIRVAIVRHGQSTWNAQTRVQGSSNLSVLTEKGREQARASQRMLQNEMFDRMYVSPLARARETADIVWQGREPIPRSEPLVLREIDLYSFQGLTKAEVKAAFPSQYADWHNHPERFFIDGHAPVREMWHRGSLAWQTILDPEIDAAPSTSPSRLLVVAHNNTNQALLATALGLPCTYFRRLLQNNAAMSSLLLQPGASSRAAPEVTLERLNQSPGGNLFKQDDKVAARVVLMAKAETAALQAAGAALLAKTQVDAVLCGPYQPAQQASRLVVRAQLEAGHAAPDVNTLMDAGSALASEEVWATILSYVATADGPFRGGSSPSPPCVVVITDACATAALLCRALGMGTDRIGVFKISAGSVSLLEFSGSPTSTPCAMRCINSTAHLQQLQP